MPSTPLTPAARDEWLQFGVSIRRVGAIRRMCAKHGIRVVGAERKDGLSYLQFMTDREKEKAIKLIYRGWEHEFGLLHWMERRFR